MKLALVTQTLCRVYYNESHCMYRIKNFYAILPFCVCVCCCFGLYAAGCVWAAVRTRRHILLQTTRTGYKVQYVEKL